MEDEVIEFWNFHGSKSAVSSGGSGSLHFLDAAARKKTKKNTLLFLVASPATNVAGLGFPVASFPDYN